MKNTHRTTAFCRVMEYRAPGYSLHYSANFPKSKLSKSRKLTSLEASDFAKSLVVAQVLVTEVTLVTGH
jgi:hypothetical protein